MTGVVDIFEARAKLSKRQAMVLDYIEHSIAERGYPPTIREIAGHMGIRSTNGVTDHLKALERKGLITRDQARSRAIQPVHPIQPVQLDGDWIEVPVLGRIAAGAPILAQENVEDTVKVDSFFIGQHRKVFALRVVGESMIGDGIYDGDYIFVKKQATAVAGDIVVALIEDEATVKRFYPERDRVRFQPSNPDMDPIYVRRADFRETMILGVVVGVFRRM